MLLWKALNQIQKFWKYVMEGISVFVNFDPAKNLCYLPFPMLTNYKKNSTFKTQDLHGLRWHGNGTYRWYKQESDECQFQVFFLSQFPILFSIINFTHVQETRSMHLVLIYMYKRYQKRKLLLTHKKLQNAYCMVTVPNVLLDSFQEKRA